MSRPSFSLLLALLALAGTGAGLLYQHAQETQMRAELGGRLAQFQSAVQQAQAAAQAAASRVQVLDGRVAALEHQQAAAQAQQATLQTLQRDLLRDRREWKLAEIEHMLYAANDQLQTTGNVRGAILALEIANRRLALQNDPRLLRLRAALNQDLAALRGVEQPDIPVVSLQLGQLAQEVSAWPLVSSASRWAAPAQANKAPAGMLDRLLADFRQLVQIHRLGTEEPVLLTPQQGQYLRDNLRLRLLSARLGLLARDQTAFHQDIAAALLLTQRYFNDRDAAVAGGLQTLRRLARLNAAPPIPSLDATLGALQALSPPPR